MDPPIFLSSRSFFLYGTSVIRRAAPPLYNQYPRRFNLGAPSYLRDDGVPSVFGSFPAWPLLTRQPAEVWSFSFVQKSLDLLPLETRGPPLNTRVAPPELLYPFFFPPFLSVGYHPPPHSFEGTLSLRIKSKSTTPTLWATWRQALVSLH